MARRAARVQDYTARGYDMVQHRQKGSPFAWFTATELDALALPVHDAGPWCRVLAADLRDPRLTSHLKPSPVTTDYTDEARKASGDRAYFLARRAVHRSLIASLAHCDSADVLIRYDDDGAPRVVSHPHYRISIAGHGPFALLAIANAPVGVDFEPIESSASVVMDVLHSQEQQRLERLSKNERPAQFLRIWTAKEAVLKARGRGFLEDPAQVCIGVDADTFTIAIPAQAANAMNGMLAIHTIGGTPFQCAAALLVAEV